MEHAEVSANCRRIPIHIWLEKIIQFEDEGGCNRMTVMLKEVIDESNWKFWDKFQRKSNYGLN